MAYIIKNGCLKKALPIKNLSSEVKKDIFTQTPKQKEIIQNLLKRKTKCKNI